MHRHLLRAAALIVAIGLQGQAVRAQDNHVQNDRVQNNRAQDNRVQHNHVQDNPILDFLFGHQDPRLTATGIGLGAASTGASYLLTHKHGVPAVRTASPGFALAVTSFGCAVLYPILGTLVLHRALTPREAYTGIAGCVIPFVGSWIVDQALPHTAWYDGTPVAHPRRYHLRHRPK
jgi:hypothetical protein